MIHVMITWHPPHPKGFLLRKKSAFGGVRLPDCRNPSILNHPNSSVVLVLISHVSVCKFHRDKPKRRSEFPACPQMSFRISFSRVRMVAKEKIRRPSFQKLQRPRRWHRHRNRRCSLNMVRLHVQFNPFYLVFRRCSPEACLGEFPIFPFSKHLISIFRTKLKLPHRNTNAVIPPFIFILKSFIALAKYQFFLHFSPREARCHARERFI